MQAVNPACKYAYSESIRSASITTANGGTSTLSTNVCTTYGSEPKDLGHWRIIGWTPYYIATRWREVQMNNIGILLAEVHCQLLSLVVARSLCCLQLHLLVASPSQCT